MTLKERINKHVKAAMQACEAGPIGAIRMLRALINQKAIDVQAMPGLRSSVVGRADIREVARLVNRRLTCA